MKKFTSILLIIATVVFSTGSFLFSPKVATAATMSTAVDIMNNETINLYSTHTIKFRTPSAIHTAGNTIAIAFPSDFDFTSIGITTADIQMKDGPSTGVEYIETFLASPDATNWGAVFTDGACAAGKKCTLTLTAPTDGIGTHDVVANDFITITYTSTHAKNPSTAGSKTISLTTTADSGSVNVPIVSSSTVTLDATVAPTLTFSNDNTTLHFGTLSTSAPQYANSTVGTGSDSVGNTFTISTNAVTGYTLAYTSTGTLTAVNGSATIPAASFATNVGTAGTAQFAMSADYNGTITNLLAAYRHSVPGWTFAPGGATLVTNTSPASSETVAMHYLANISNVTPAGVYAQANTWVVTANF